MTSRAILLTVLCLPFIAVADDPVTAELDRAVAFFDARLARDPDDFPAANQLCDRLMRRHRWTGKINDLRRAGEVAELSLKSVGPRQNPGGLAARGEVAFAMHRFSEARDIALELAPLMAGKAFPPQLLGDAQLELGDLDAAQSAFAEMAKRAGDAEPGVEARLGRLAWMRGEIATAREHFDAAENIAEALSADSPETFVWALVQSGELGFKTGDWDRAEAAYAKARELAPDHWSVLDHLAELRAAQGRDAEALALYQQAIDLSHRPEISQALGDYHAFVRRPEEAAAACKEALAGYRESIDRGEVLYVHHLAGFFADSQEDAAEAVKWAKRDLELRQSSYAWDALAWAQYRAGDFEAAKASSRRALAHGLADSHVLYHAGMIHLSAADITEGQRLLKLAIQVNPHSNAFHSHR